MPASPFSLADKVADHVPPDCAIGPGICQVIVLPETIGVSPLVPFPATIGVSQSALSVSVTITLYAGVLPVLVTVIASFQYPRWNRL